jgi:hypothetical protein
MALMLAWCSDDLQALPSANEGTEGPHLPWQTQMEMPEMRSRSDESPA